LRFPRLHVEAKCNKFKKKLNSMTFPGLSTRHFFSKFKNLELGKTFENGTDFRL
jgi:hypothetical protein